MRALLYRFIYKYLNPRLPQNQFWTGVKWRIALILVGTEFHEYNLDENRDKLLIHFTSTRELQIELSSLLDKLNLTETAKVLDVGAGPISKVGKIYRGAKIDLVAIDPVANQYSRILKSLNLIPVVETVSGYGEKLTKQFQLNFFDLIHARNCIDHSKNPILVIMEALRVLKPGGYFYLNHYLNEGQVAAYYGLHQWNFFEKNNLFYISNQDHNIKICVDDEIRPLAIIEKIQRDHKRLIVIFKKDQLSKLEKS